MSKSLGKILRDYMYEDICTQGERVLRNLEAYERQIADIPFLEDFGQAERIFICGCGDSYYAGEAVKEAFLQYAGIDIVPSEAFEFVTYDYRKLKKKDLVIAISVSGKVGTTLDCIEKAREREVKALGLNADRTSRIWKAADWVIDIMQISPIEGPVPQTCHYLANMVVLVLLALQAGRKKGMLSEKAYQKEWEALRYNLQVMNDNAKTLAPAAREIAEKALGNYPFVMVGHGVNLATARFGVAKLHEAALQGHIVQETEEWAHEERQMTRENIFTFVIAEGRGLLRSQEILNMIASFKSHGVAIVNESHATEVTAEYCMPVKMADSETLSPMSLKLPLELFAYYMAELQNSCPFNFENVQQTKSIEKMIYKEDKG